MEFKNLKVDLLDFFSNYSDAILLTDENDNIIFANIKIKKIFELENTFCFITKYKNLKEIFNESNKLNLNISLFNNYLTQNEDVYYYKIKINENYKFLELTKNFIIEGQVPKYFIYTIRDLTNFFNIENIYKIFFENANDAIFIMENDTFIDCNKKTLEIFGLKNKDQIIGKPPYLFSPPTQPDGKNSKVKALEKIDKALKGEPQFFEWVHSKLDGTSFYTEVSLNAFEYNDKKYVQAIVRDITEKKLDEQKIKEYNQKLQNIIEATNAGTWEWNVQTGEVTFNEIWANILGYRLEELLPTSIKTWESLTHPEDLKKTYEILEKHFKGKSSFYEYEFRMRHKNGNWVWILDKGKVISWTEDGKPHMMYGIHINISRLKEAELALLQSREFINNVLNTIPVRVFWKDKNLKYLGCNKPFAKDAGYNDPEDIIGKTDFEMGWHEQAELYRKDDKEVIEKSNSKIGFEESQTTPTGSTIWLRTSKTPLKDEKGEIIGILGTYEDITKQKEVEKNLIESEEKFRTLAESSPTSIIVYQDYKFVYVNNETLKITGYSREEMSNLNCWDIVYPDDKLKIKEKMQKRQKGIIGKENYEIRLVTKNKETKWVYVVSETIQYKGRPAGLVSLLDITEKINLLEQTQKIQRFESLGFLAAGIAHDFNNILEGVYGFIDLARESSDLSTIKNYLKDAVMSIERAKGLTNQLLTFSKGGAPRTKLQSIEKLIKDIVEFTVSGKKVKVEYNFGKDLLFVEIDENQISQVIQNIVLNSLQAMQDGGKIYIDVSNIYFNELDNSKLKGDYIKISITDEGVGIPPEILSKIFDPFFTTKSTGNGLGLSVCQSIINKHNGFIDAKSSVGKGSTFTIYLPGKKEKPMENRQNKFKSDFFSKKVLILDDEEVMLKVMKRMLEKFGFEVESATNGIEAIEKYFDEKENKKPFDLLIFDMTIKNGMSGKEAILKIKEKDKDILAFVMTGYSDDDVIKNPKEFGFDDSITKPFTTEDLIKLLSRYF